MATHHISSTAMTIALVAGAAVSIAIYKVYSRWVDGKQKKEK